VGKQLNNHPARNVLKRESTAKSSCSLLDKPNLSFNIRNMLACGGGVKVNAVAKELKAESFKFAVHQCGTRFEPFSFV
jgi:hypothetical protein